MTFEQWFNNVENEDECSVSEIVWHHGPHKNRDVVDLLEEAYKAGWSSCADKLGGDIKWLQKEELLEVGRGSIIKAMGDNENEE